MVQRSMELMTRGVEPAKMRLAKSYTHEFDGWDVFTTQLRIAELARTKPA
jgi:hypothetical protein